MRQKSNSTPVTSENLIPDIRRSTAGAAKLRSPSRAGARAS